MLVSDRVLISKLISNWPLGVVRRVSGRSGRPELGLRRFLFSSEPSFQHPDCDDPVPRAITLLDLADPAI